jgi:hypothetical protein
MPFFRVHGFENVPQFAIAGLAKTAIARTRPTGARFPPD